MSLLSLHDIHLRPAVLKAVEEKARSEGKTAAEYIRRLIEKDVLASKTFDEMLKPVRADFRKSGLTEADLGELVERARRAPPPKARGARP